MARQPQPQRLSCCSTNEAQEAMVDSLRCAKAGADGETLRRSTPQCKLELPQRGIGLP